MSSHRTGLNVFVLDRRSDLRHFISFNAPPRKPEHTVLLHKLWPKGDKSATYGQLMPSVAGRKLYSNISKRSESYYDLARYAGTSLDDFHESDFAGSPSYPK